MGECKIKAIQTNVGRFRHNQTCPEIIQADLELGVTLTYLKLWYIQNPEIFRNRSVFRSSAHSGPCYIQKSATFKTLAAYSKSEANSEPCHISTMKR